MSWPNWWKLFTEWRCKAIWVSWTNEDLKARYTYWIPAEYVRLWVLTPSQYQAVKDKEVKDDWQLLEEAQAADKPKSSGGRGRGRGRDNRNRSGNRR